MKQTISITIAAVFLLLGGCASPEPRDAAPDVTKSFKGDHWELARCIRDAIAAVNPKLPKVVLQGPDTVIVTLVVPGGTDSGGGRLTVSHFTVKKSGADKTLVEYRALMKTAYGSGRPEDVGWRMVEKCGRGEGIARGDGRGTPA